MSNFELATLSVQIIGSAVALGTLLALVQQVKTAVGQLSTAKESAGAQSTLALVNFLQAKEVHQARGHVRGVLKDKARDTWTKDDERLASLVVSNYDVLGALLLNGIASKEIIIPNWGPSIKHCYEILEQFINKHQNDGPGTHARYWSNFKWLYEEVIAAEKLPGSDPYDLQRFVDSQQKGGIDYVQCSNYDTALAELKNGDKTTHWIWYVFPQMNGLGTSRTAGYYGIKHIGEAKEYLKHPDLGPRLCECVETLLKLDKNRTAEEILRSPDHLKFCSSLTLFERAAKESGDARQAIFTQALDKYYGGKRDEKTLAMLGPEKK